MTLKKWSGFGLGLSISIAYLIGCATARLTEEPSARAQYAPPPQHGPAGPPVRAWAYVCTEGYNAETITQRANDLGAQGWEMVAAANARHAPGLWCFKRPR